MTHPGEGGQVDGSSDSLSDPQGVVTSGQPSRSIPLVGRLLAVDVGEKRIGLALSDPLQKIAQPLITLTRRAGRRFPMKQLKAQLVEHGPVGFVVGLPLSPEGSELDWAKEVRAVGSLIGQKTGLPVAYWDERMTTGRAMSAIRDLGGGLRGRKAEIDQLAATTLLQAFLDSRKK